MDMHVHPPAHQACESNEERVAKKWQRSLGRCYIHGGAGISAQLPVQGKQVNQAQPHILEVEQTYVLQRARVASIHMSAQEAKAPKRGDKERGKDRDTVYRRRCGCDDN